MAEISICRGPVSRLRWGVIFSALAFQALAFAGLPNPVLFVTQVPIPLEVNGTVSNTFVSVVSLFGNHTADTARAGRGGDLCILYTNGTVRNLTRAGGFGQSGPQHTNGIAVRDPHVHWSGARALFSMVTGAPRFAGDTNEFRWQLFELRNLDVVAVDPNATPQIVAVDHQPLGYNNVMPCYGTDGRIIFISDRPLNGVAWLYPARDEYKGQPTANGTWSLEPVAGDLRLLNHTPSGAFNPFVDSFGRVIESRWDHLVQDANATDDRLGRATNGAFNFLAEAPNAATSTDTVEMFPEPRNFDTQALAQLQMHGNSFNFFFPWMLPQAGGAEELLNHVGRHEISFSILNSFTNDANLISFTNPAARGLFGITSANTNYLNNFVQIAEDPLNPGTYFGVDAPDFSPFGDTHAAGQIVALTGPSGMNPTNMTVRYITAKSTAGPNALGVFRNPLPMSDGSLLAAYTPAANLDTNLGTAAFPKPLYQFRLVLLTNTGSIWSTNRFLTAGVTNPATYYDGTLLVTYTNALWELQPVEVRARPVPSAWLPGVDPIEQQVFAQEQVDLAAFQAELITRELALVVSRNVTARDGADKQQPYNLRVPGGVQTVGTNSGRLYDITHLQFLQADYRRAYTYGTTNIQPGRRVLATPVHDLAALNYTSSLASPPPGGTQLMPDGSQATLVPANRAVTWQLTGTTNESLVKERYWITFRPGEVRTCANCHGINAQDQAGHASPTNAPLALRQLLRFWRTNAASAFNLSVQGGVGSGQYGAGSIIAITAAAAPAGQIFDHWAGATVLDSVAAATTLVMPGANTTVSALYKPLPAPALQLSGAPGGVMTITANTLPNLTWLLQSSDDLVSWQTVNTNLAGPDGTLNFVVPVNPSVSKRFYRFAAP